MKRWIVALGLLALCAGPTFAGGIGLFGGYVAPSDADEQEGFGIKAQFDTGRHADFQIRLSVYEDVLTDANPEIFQMEVVPFDLGFNWDFGEDRRANPYVGGGLTYWVLDFSYDSTLGVDPPRGVDADPEIGVYVEAGVEADLNDIWEFFAEVVFRTGTAEAEGDDLGTFRDQEVDLSGVAGHLGLSISW